MKKALLALLVLSMVMTMVAVAPLGAGAEEAQERLPIGAVAEGYKPEGKAVSSAEDFAAMEPGGSYYLAGDITISASYATNFTGVFDGNGKTITTTAPVFAEFNGTGKNLLIKGNIVLNEKNPVNFTRFTGKDCYQTGAFSIKIANAADVKVSNIRTDVNITSSVGGMGGIAGGAQCEEDFKLVVERCANYGNMVGSLKSNRDSGGLIGMAKAAYKEEPMLIMEDCENYGTINTGGRPGGIVGIASTSAVFKNCYNKGDLQSISNYCGGICGRIDDSEDDDNQSKTVTWNQNVFLFEDCVNEGNINVYKSEAGGMCGWCGRLKKVTFKGCINRGNIMYSPAKKDPNLAGIFGSGNGAATSFVYENCINYGQIGDDGFGGYGGGITGYYKETNKKQDNTYINCANYGTVYGGKMVGGILGKSYCTSGGKLRFEGCINYGELIAARQCGGILSYAESGISPVFIGCGNAGKVYSKSHYAGGLVGYHYAGGSCGPVIRGCFNTGTVESATTKDAYYVGGLVGYMDCAYPYSDCSYNMIGGQIISHAEAKPVEAGTSFDVPNNYCVYTYPTAAGDKYFRVPRKGTVTISADGKTVTFVSSSAFPTPEKITLDANNVSTASVPSSYKVCLFDMDGVTYAFMNKVADDKVVVKTKTSGGKQVPDSVEVQGIKVYWTKWMLGDDLKTLVLPVYDHDLNTTALFWSNNNSFYFDPSTNLIEEGVADLDYSMGFGNAWNMTGGLPDGQETRLPHEAFTDGTVAATLNGIYRDATGKKEDLYYQNLMATIFTPDEYPTTDARHAKVILSGGVYTNQIIEFNDNVTPPTGDAAIYVVITLAVSSLALAVLAVTKKKKVRSV